jgi:hypothetical protein
MRGSKALQETGLALAQALGGNEIQELSVENRRMEEKSHRQGPITQAAQRKLAQPCNNREAVNRCQQGRAGPVYNL